MKFAVHVRQAADGCDYSIGCGVAVSIIDAASPEAVLALVTEEWRPLLDPDREQEISTIDIYEVVGRQQVDIAAVHAEIRAAKAAARAAASEQAERAEYERLSRKFGRPA